MMMIILHIAAICSVYIFLLKWCLDIINHCRKQIVSFMSKYCEEYIVQLLKQVTMGGNVRGTHLASHKRYQ